MLFSQFPPKPQSLHGLCLYLMRIFFSFPPAPRSKDTTVSGVKTWLWFGFSKAMSRAGLPPRPPSQWASERSGCPHMCSVGPALPTLLIAGDVLDSVQLTSTRLDASLSEEVPLETRTEFVNKNTFGHRRLSCLAWRQSVGLGRFNCKTGNGGHASAVTS